MVKMNNISGPNWKFGAADCWLRGTKSDPGAERVPSHPKVYGNMPQNRKKNVRNEMFSNSIFHIQCDILNKSTINKKMEIYNQHC